MATCVQCNGKATSLGTCLECVLDMADCTCPKVEQAGGDAWTDMPASTLQPLLSADDTPLPATDYDGAPHPADVAALVERHAGTAATTGALDAGADDEWFWTSRPALAQVRAWAQARRAGPYATLAEVLAGVLCRVPPSIQLPALIGGRGSLNMIFAAVGPSSDGKGAALHAADAAMDWSRCFYTRVTTVQLSTGEGLERTYGTGKRGEDDDYKVTRTHWRALFIIREIDRLEALMSRRGGILSSTLRQVYSGEELGSGNATAELRVPIPRHAYRACVSLGVQPKRGAVLLAEEDGGLPQRILWLPTSDPGVPDVKPADPARICWQPPAEIARLAEDATDPVEIDVCATAVETIDRARVARMRGDGSALDGHSLFTREKTAAALALFDGRLSVSDDDWKLAGHLMDVSNRVRDWIAATLKAADAERNAAQGHAEAGRAVIVEDSTDAHKTRKAKDRALTVLGGGEWHSHSDARRSMGRHREYFEDALDALMAAGLVESRETPSGHGSAGRQYRLARP